MKRAALKGSLVVLILSLFIVSLSKYSHLLDTRTLITHLSSLGFPLLIVLLPYVLIMLSDTCGWRIAFGNAATQAAAGKLLMIRIATETLQVSLPGGAMYAELVRPMLLKKHLRMDYAKSISANIITKTNILLAQVIFIVAGVLLLLMHPPSDLASTGLRADGPALVVVIACMALPFLLAYLVYSRNLLLWLVLVLTRMNLRISRRVLDKIREPLSDINKRISAFSRDHKARLVLTVLFFFLSWVLMSCEALIILKVMGVDATIVQAIVIESLISVVRVVFFFIPGALGPQDVALAMLFNLSGLPDPLANGLLFVMIRRSKELVWIVAGYVLLLVLGVNPRELIRGRQMGPGTTPATS